MARFKYTPRDPLDQIAEETPKPRGGRKATRSVTAQIAGSNGSHTGSETLVGDYSETLEGATPKDAQECPNRVAANAIVSQDANVNDKEIMVTSADCNKEVVDQHRANESPRENRPITLGQSGGTMTIGF